MLTALATATVVLTGFATHDVIVHVRAWIAEFPTDAETLAEKS